MRAHRRRAVAVRVRRLPQLAPPQWRVARLRVAISLIMFAMLAGAQAGATAGTLAPGSHLVDIRYDGLITVTSFTFRR